MSTVSVIIPTYNRAETLPGAIDSVLDQTYDDFELIVVDDASTDSTPSIVGAYGDSRLRYERHEINRNASAARNTGVRIATGEYVAFLDSDDIWQPRKLDTQLEYLQSKSDSWIAVYCDVTKKRSHVLKQLIDPFVPPKTGLEGGSALIKDVLSTEIAIHAGSTLLAERKAVAGIDGFDESFERHQDLEFLIRLLEIGKLGYVNEPLVTLYDSGYPAADLVRREKTRFLSKYDDYVERYEQQGFDIFCSHYYTLAKAYCREGELRQGFEYLTHSCIKSVRDLMALKWAICVGVRSRLR